MVDSSAYEIPVDRVTISAFALDFASNNTNATLEDVLQAARNKFNIWWGKQTGKTAFIESVAQQYYQTHIAYTSYPPPFRTWWRSRCDDHTKERVYMQARADWEEAVLRIVREEYINTTRSRQHRR